MRFSNMLYYLSEEFYHDYPQDSFPEILWNKNGRAYNCLLINSHKDYYICVPFRSNINHNYAFLFRDSARSRCSRSGLDYKKMIIIKNTNYLDLERIATVDNDEYSETMRNMDKIVNEVEEFLQCYIDYIKGVSEISQQEFRRKYNMSTLPYFHRELSL